MFKSVKAKIIANYGLAMLLILAITASLFVSISSQKSEGRYINLAGKLRMVSQKISKEALGVFRGSAETKTLGKTVDLYDKILHGLINGDESLGLVPTENEEILTQLKKVQGLWTPFRSAAEKIISTGSTGNEDAMKFIEANNIALLKNMNKAVGMYEAEGQAKLGVIQELVIGFLIIALIAFVFVMRQMMKTIINPLHEIGVATENIAKGNLEVEINVDTDDEIGNLGKNLNRMLVEIRKGRKEILKEKEAVEIKVKDAVKEAETQSEYLKRNIDMLLVKVGKFAEGDLTVEIIPEKADDDLGKLVTALNVAIGNIKNMTSKLQDAIEATASASTQISSSAEEMAAGAQEQSSQTTEVASAVEEMTSTIVETTNNSKIAVNESNNSKEIAENGGKIFEELAEGMENISSVVLESTEIVDELGKSSEKIGEIVHVINDIADQTNLLALNAAIEAARAGEQGRGFAVVADEVRKLAERTTGATKEIEEMIKTIQSETGKAVGSMHSGTEQVTKGKEKAAEAGESLQEIIDSSGKVMQIINQTALASEEQNLAAEEISKNIIGINTVAQETAIGVEQIATASNDLSRLTDNLQQLVNSFKLNEVENYKMLN